MADLKSLVRSEMDRAGEPAFALEDLEGLRVRRHRRKRITAAAVGLGLLLIFAFAGTSIYRSAPVQRPAERPTPTSPRPVGVFANVGGWITYGTPSGIWAVDPAQPGDPSTPIQLSSVRATPIDWSSDGAKLLVLRKAPRGKDAFPHYDLYTLNADGTSTRVTDPGGWINGGSFSSDGTEVVYDMGNAIYAVDAEGGTPRLVTRGEGNLYEAAYSPDGSLIAYFDGAGDHSNALYVMNADGSEAQALTGPDYGHIDELVWSPDGSRLAFSLAGGGLFVVGADGSGLTELIPDGERVAWSPDGSRISFQRRHGTPVEEVRNGETVEVTYCPCNLGRLEIVTLDGGEIQEFGYAGSGPWNPLG